MMKSLPIAFLVIAFACSMHAAPAQAQRVFVSATGSDGNPCTFALPCRGFQHAHDVVASGGEIDVLDPAGYGTVTITKSISIQGHGFSGISVSSGGTGITINAPGAAVNLNGLLIDGAGVGNDGIDFNAGKSLTVENCVVRNVTNIGLAFTPSNTTLNTLSVSDSYFNDSGSGITIQPFSSGALTASIDRTAFYDNGGEALFVSGAVATGAIDVAVTDSVAANGFFGFDVTSSAGHSATNLSLTHSLAVGNQAGVIAQGTNATLWLAQSTVTGNASGFTASIGGVIMSYGDNYLAAANGSNSGTLTSATKQ